jgi:hypothetical protein
MYEVQQKEHIPSSNSNLSFPETRYILGLLADEREAIGI